MLHGHFFVSHVYRICLCKSRDKDTTFLVLQKHYRYLEAIALEHDEVEEVTDLTQPDQGRITRRAGTLLEHFKELVYPSGYDPDKTSTGKRKVGNN